MGEFGLKDTILELYLDKMDKMEKYRKALDKIFNLVNGSDSGKEIYWKVLKITKEALYGKF